MYWLGGVGRYPAEGGKKNAILTLCVMKYRLKHRGGRYVWRGRDEGGGGYVGMSRGHEIPPPPYSMVGMG